MNEIADRPAALAFLMGRINYERTGRVPYRANRLKLDRMRQFLDLLGRPHLACPTIHLSGTKGKGSTAALTAAILHEAGLTTGLHTSPHLDRLEERFTVNGAECDETELVEIVDMVAQVVSKMDLESGQKGETGPTFFEITTALAWLRFARHKVDCAVVEVGLGGRLDSTNVCQPSVTAVTSISLDHTRQLGNDLSSIAREKAGILKAGVPVVIGPLAAEPFESVSRIANERRCPIWKCERDYLAEPLGPDRFRYAEPAIGIEFDQLELGLLGQHQQSNAAIAICLARRFAEQTGATLDESAIRSGLSSVSCSARVERISQSPLVILDAAHNEASAQALCAVLREIELGGPTTLVFSTSRDKDASAMLDVFAEFFDTIIVTQFQETTRAAQPESILESWRPDPSTAAASTRVEIETDPRAAWRLAISNIDELGMVCVAGSFFLAAELRAIMREDVGR
jgi:dihydrofolate synthase/folylpolyglutamate synthase